MNYQSITPRASRMTNDELRIAFYGLCLLLFALFFFPTSARAQSPIDFIPGWDASGADDYAASVQTASVAAQYCTPPLCLAWSSDELGETWSVAWGDYDGDGDLDLVVGNWGRPNRLYRNDGGMLTLAWSTNQAAATTSVAWGDYDGDGALDLAVGNYDHQPNRLYHNDGRTLTLAWTSIETDDTVSVAWGDYDGDGALDLAVGNDGQPNRLYHNDGGTLTLAWTSIETDSTMSVAWGDYDGDGALDLAVGNDGQPNRLYHNDGGTFTLAWTAPITNGTQSVAWGDYDGDGDLDLVVGNWETDNQLYRNDGVIAGIPQMTPVWAIESNWTRSVAWGDYDGDGDLDLAVGADANRLYRNDGLIAGLPQITLAWTSAGSYNRSVAWGDYDGDGDLDLAVGADANRLYRNDGGGMLRNSVWMSTENDWARSVAWGDYDGDGDLDLAVGSDGHNRLYRNDGGTLMVSAVWSSTESGGDSVAWGDYDSDSDLDLAVGSTGQPTRLYQNDGKTLSASAVWSSTESANTYSVAWGDYDGDGDLDLAVGNVSQPNRLYRNDDKVLSASAVWSSTESNGTRSVAWGDYDGDGDLDLAVGNAGLPNQLYRNDGGMLTPSAVWSSMESDYTTSIAWGDYDGDGDLDLAVGNYGLNRLYRNDGGKLTPSAVWSPTETDWTSSVAWGDYDGDGDLDLAIGATASRLYRNDGGTLNPSTIWSSIYSSGVYDVAWGDVDNDGDLDLVAGNNGFNRLYRNGRDGRSLPGSTPTVSMARPGANADSYSLPGVSSGIIPITYTLADPQDDLVKAIRAWYSPDGGGKWHQAVAASGTVTTNLAPVGGPYKRLAGYWKFDEGYGTLALDSSGHALTGALLNGPVFTTTTPPSITFHNPYALGFDGVDDYVNVGSSITLANASFTLAAWARRDASGAYHLIISQGPSVANQGLQFGFRDDNRFYCGFWGNDLDTPSAYTDTAWHHWACTYDAQSRRRAIYRDGSLATWDTASANYQGSGDLWIGARAAACFSGFLDDVRIYRYALSAAEIQTLAHPMPLPVFKWDTFTSGFFGQSDNVVFRIQAVPDITNNPNATPGPYLYGAYASQTFPFRVRGTQVRVMNEPIVVDGIIDYGYGEPIANDPVDPPQGNANMDMGDLYITADRDSFYIAFTIHDDIGVTQWGKYCLYIDTTNDANGATSDAWFRKVVVNDPHKPEYSLCSWVDVPPYGPEDTELWTWNQGTASWSNLGIVVTAALKAGPTSVIEWQVAKTDLGDPDTLWVEAWSTGGGSSDPAQDTVNAPANDWNASDWSTTAMLANSTQYAAFDGGVVDALVYRLPEGQPTDGFLLGDSGGTPLRTDPHGYLQGRGQLDLGDQLLALAPISTVAEYAGILLFDGIDDTASVAVLNGAPVTETTVSFWISTTQGTGRPFAYASPATNRTFLIANPGNLTLWRGNTYSVTTGVTVTDGAWHHIAATWRSSDGHVRLYKDGLAVYTDTLAVGTTIPPSGTLTLGSGFAGALDSVHFWDVALATEQILEDGWSLLPPAAAPNVGAWAFDDPEAPSSDSSGAGNTLTPSGATWDGVYLGGYTVYHTNGTPTTDGVDAFTMQAPGVQVITVTAAHPLILFDLNVSLEWDAHNDLVYLQQLEIDLKRASAYLYDFTDGQAALGYVTVYQNADAWDTAHIVIQASNRLRPFASIGGLLTTIFSETVQAEGQAHTLTYGPGQVRIGATWNRYGDPAQSLGVDWPLILAHELSHYLLYQYDVYMGLNEVGLLIPEDACTGSAMGDVYALDNTEFISDTLHWGTACSQTLAARTLGRPEWATLRAHYPWLITPIVANEGPYQMPFEFTTVAMVSPTQAVDAIEDPTFYLDYEYGGVSSSEARAFLLRDVDNAPNLGPDDFEYVYDLGNPIGGQNRVLARGGRVGDRLCVLDSTRTQFGCEVIAQGDERLTLRRDTTWTPVLQIRPVNSTTFTLQVTHLASDSLALKARVFPEFGSAFTVTDLAYVSALHGYTGTLRLDYPVMLGYVQVWADEDVPPTETRPRPEAFVGFSLGGNPSPGRVFGGTPGRVFGGTPGRVFGGTPGRVFGGGSLRAGEAPMASPDGQLILYVSDAITFAAGQFYIIQAMAGLPPLPPGRTVVGQGYNLVATGFPSGTDALTGSVSLQYLGSDVLATGADENDLELYFWDGAVWEALPTVLNPTYNMASARSQGPGIYALFASTRISLIGPGWNLFAYHARATVPVTQALLSINGYYTTVYGYDPADTDDPWKLYDVTVPDVYRPLVNDLTVLEFGKGYWINVSQTITLYLGNNAVLSVMGYEPTIHNPQFTMPLPPSTFYGTLDVAGGELPGVGIQMAARIGEQVCGQTWTREVDGRRMYAINVFAEGAGVNGCGAPGKIVTFQVDGQPMLPAVLWDNRKVWEVTLRPARSIYLTLVLRH